MLKGKRKYSHHNKDPGNPQKETKDREKILKKARERWRPYSQRNRRRVIYGRLPTINCANQNWCCEIFEVLKEKKMQAPT